MKTLRKIEKRPPAPTGDAAADAQALADYLDWLREQINFILTLIERRLNEGGDG